MIGLADSARPTAACSAHQPDHQVLYQTFEQPIKSSNWTLKKALCPRLWLKPRVEIQEPEGALEGSRRGRGTTHATVRVMFAFREDGSGDLLGDGGFALCWPDRAHLPVITSERAATTSGIGTYWVLSVALSSALAATPGWQYCSQEGGGRGRMG